MNDKKRDFRGSAVIAFCEEMEGILLAAGLKDQRPDLLALLPPCERKWIEGKGWKESLECLWNKAQILRIKFGSEEAQDSKRSCVPFGIADCECSHANEERLEAIEKICCDPKFDNRNKWRVRYPYGVWGCADGAEYLFNRLYRPFLRRSSGGMVSPVLSEKPREPWIDFVRQGWFYSDNTQPRYVLDTRELLVEVMEAFHAGRDVWRYVESDSEKKLEVVK